MVFFVITTIRHDKFIALRVSIQKKIIIVEMPTPPRKTRSRASSKRSSPTRKNLFNDPMLAAMKRGDMLWGDLMMMTAPAAAAGAGVPRRRTPTPPPTLSPWSIEDEALEDYVTPRLGHLEDLRRHFPIDIVKVPRRDKAYAVRFNRDALMEMRNAANISWDAAMEYEAFQEYRLLHALRAHADLFRLEKPSSKDDVVIVHLIEKPARAGAGDGAAMHVPELRRLSDIKDKFPGVVVWRKVEGRKGESTYALEVMRTFERSNPPHVVDRVLHELKMALEASKFWYVLPARDRSEWMRLEMRHD